MAQHDFEEADRYGVEVGEGQHQHNPGEVIRHNALLIVPAVEAVDGDTG